MQTVQKNLLEISTLYKYAKGERYRMIRILFLNTD